MPFKSQKYNCLLHIVPPQTCLSVIRELRQAVMNVIFHMKTDQFVQIFDDWVRRHKKCVELKGDYVEKRKLV
jgi:hypothetical protein